MHCARATRLGNIACFDLKYLLVVLPCIIWFGMKWRYGPWHAQVSGRHVHSPTSYLSAAPELWLFVVVERWLACPLVSEVLFSRVPVVLACIHSIPVRQFGQRIAYDLMQLSEPWRNA